MALTKFVNVYKCRLCGEMFTSSGTNSEIAAWKGTLHEIMKASGLDTPCSTPEVTPTMFEMHSCKNGSYGVADFRAHERRPTMMQACEQLSLFSIVPQAARTAICCMDGECKAAAPAESWMADLVPVGNMRSASRDTRWF